MSTRKLRKRSGQKHERKAKVPTRPYLPKGTPRGLGLMSPAELMMRILMRRSR